MPPPPLVFQPPLLIIIAQSLRQTRGLAENPVLQRVLLKLLGSKEEIAIAREIDKATKSYPPTPLLRGFQSRAQHSFFFFPFFLLN